MATSEASIVVENPTDKVSQKINSSQVNARSSLTKTKAKAGTEGEPWKTSLWACCVPADLCMLFSSLSSRGDEGLMTA